MSLKHNDRDEIWEMIQQALANTANRAAKGLQLLNAHSISTGVTTGLNSTVASANAIATVSITPKVTGKFRVVGLGTVQNNSTLQMAVSFQILTQTTTGATASTVVNGSSMEVPGTSVTGFATPIVQFGLQGELSSGLAQPVSVAGNIILAATVSSGATGTLSVTTGATLDVQEIF
jgi:hypothetical protein